MSFWISCKEEAVHLFEVLRRPLVTEKNSALTSQGKYVFEVTRDSNKKRVKDAVEKAFNVTVTKVNIVVVPGNSRRVGRRLVAGHPWKKAFVTLAKGDKIELFEGV